MKKTIQTFIKEKRYSDIYRHINQLNDIEISEFLNQFNFSEGADLTIIFRLLPKDRAANIFSYLSSENQKIIINTVSDSETEKLFDDLYFDDIIDIIEEMPSNVVKKILKNTTPKDRKLINQFLNYPEDSAGSIMTIEYVDLKKSMTVGNAIKELRKNGKDKENISTCYIISDDRKLEGILSLKKLITSDDNIIIKDIMNTNFISVQTTDNQEDVANIFKKYDLIVLPVVDIENRLLGIITADDIIDVIDQEATEDFHKMAGITPSEESYLNTSALTMAKQRILWLVILMFSATFTGRIIQRYENVLQSVVILAAFIPMLMDTGGNVGSQSSTVIIRSLALGDITYRDTIRVLRKEFIISLVVSSVLGCLNFLRLITIERIPLNIALAVTITLAFTIILAKIIGAILPITAKIIKVDPAVMASPLITTIVDAFALILYFNFAILFLGVA